MAQEKVCGVYRIMNMINGHSYIGSSNFVQHRRDSHFSLLQRGMHHSKEFQDDFNIYGKSVFETRVIERNTRDKLLEREQFWIDIFKPEYNINGKSGNVIPESAKTPEAKTKIRKSVSELWKDPTYRMKHCKPRNWKNGVPNRRGVKLTEEQKQHLSEINSGENNPNYGLHRSEETKMKQSLGHTKPNKYPGAISPDGTIYAPINNMSAFCREHDLGVSEMISVMHLRRKSHKGWTLYKDV